MLTALFSMICALNMSAATPVVSVALEASVDPIVSVTPTADTVDVYVIDKVKIEKFDGSQLKGKTVLDYAITLHDGVRTHTITTSQGSEKPTSATSKPKMIYVVNGKVVSLNEMNAIKPDNIKEMRVIKNPDSPEARKYNSGSGLPVIIVTTK